MQMYAGLLIKQLILCLFNFSHQRANVIREKYCVDSETKQQKENNWDLDASENGTDRTLFYGRQRPFERTCLSLYGRDSCCGARYVPAFLARVHARARRPL